MRRVWAPGGRRPRAAVRRADRWRSVYGCVRPGTGQTWWRLLPPGSAEAFGPALAEFARDEGVGPDRRAVVALDNAGWHTAKDRRPPAGVHLAFPPAASPAVPPAERLWALADEPVATRALADVDELEETWGARCRARRGERRAVKRRTRYHRWPRERRPRKQT